MTELDTPEVMEIVKGKASKILSRELTEIESHLIEYAIIQMKYELWKW